MKRKGFVLALILFSAAALVGCTANAGAKAATAPVFQTAQVATGDIEQTVSAPGVLKFVDPVANKATAAVKVTDVAVKIGDTVHPGDTIASFDKALLSANIAALQANVTQLERQLQGLALSFHSDKKIIAGVTGTVKAVYVQNGDSVEAVVAEKGGIALISADGLMNVQFKGTGVTANEEVTVVSGKYRVTGHVSNVSDGDITVTFPDKSVLPGDTVEVYKDSNLLGNGSAQVDLPYLVPAESGTVSEVKVKVNDYVMAFLPVARVKYIDMDDSYLAAQSQLAQARADLAAAKALLDQGAILASADGIIATILPEGTYPSGVKLYDLYPQGQFEFTISVDELDIFSIALGQKAVVQLDGIPDKTFDAAVIKVSSIGQVVNGFTNYAVTLSVTDDGTLKSGLNGNVKIVVNQRSGVLTLPVEAVQEDSSGSFVTLSDDQQTKVPVQVGISDGKNIEIVSGVSEGDTVIIRTAADISSYAQ